MLGKPGEHWAMRTCPVDGSPEVRMEIFMRSRPHSVPKLLLEENESEAMPI